MKKFLDYVFLGAGLLAFILCVLVIRLPAGDEFLVPLIWGCVALTAALFCWVAIHIWEGWRL